jgi:hypothetical protein
VAKNDNDAQKCSEAKSLAENELGSFEFLVSIIIWYEILSGVNLISKQLQSKDMLIVLQLSMYRDWFSFKKKYRETGFSKHWKPQKKLQWRWALTQSSLPSAKSKEKRHFDEAVDESANVSQSEEESFRVDYFIYVIDQVIVSLTKRFEQYQEYEKTFGFLFTSDRLQSLDDKNLMAACINFENTLKSGEDKDIDGQELYAELILIQDCHT